MEKPLASTPRRLAVSLLETLDTSDTTIAALLRAHPLESPADRALLSELLYGVIRHRRYLRSILTQKLSKPLRKLPPQLPLFLEIALYQLLFLEKIPAYAIIWEAVEGVKTQWGQTLARLANGVLRTIDREKSQWVWQALPPGQYSVEQIATHYSLPDWLVARWQTIDNDDVGNDTPLALYNFITQRPHQTVRINTAVTDAAAARDALTQAGITWQSCPDLDTALIIDAPKLDRSHPLYTSGALAFQALSSQIVVANVASLLTPGDQFLDACSGAGGKVLGIAAALGNVCSYASYDPKPEVALDFSREQTRLHLPNITRRNTLDTQQISEKWNVVLVDAPCSGLGTLQKNPELKWRRAADALPRFAARQLTILTDYAPLVAPGGFLIYSVCSVEPEENEQVVATFLETHPDFTYHPLTLPILERTGSPTPYGWKLYPHRVQSEGFFIAGLKKIDTSTSTESPGPYRS